MERECQVFYSALEILGWKGRSSRFFQVFSVWWESYKLATVNFAPFVQPLRAFLDSAIFR